MSGQTDLKSDDLCSHKISVAPMQWILNPIQNNVQYNIGEIGTPTSVGLHTPDILIDISSKIVQGGAQDGNVLMKCMNPIPPIQSDLDINDHDKLFTVTGDIIKKPLNRSHFLVPTWNKFKKSESDYSHIDWKAGFSGDKHNLHHNPQNLSNIIERMWLDRGGFDSNQFIKKSFNSSENNIRQPYNIKYPFGFEQV
tara:strand:+ start:2160 stop:2747 length:588 start_codon:yes stop_codon:yes gene_type:complete